MGLSKYVKWKHIHIPVPIDKYLELSKRKEKLNKTWEQIIQKGLEAYEREIGVKG